MILDLPLSVVVDITFNSAQRLVECSPQYRRVAARNIRQLIHGAPVYDRSLIKENLKDAVAHHRKYGRTK